MPTITQLISVFTAITGAFRPNLLDALQPSSQQKTFLIKTRVNLHSYQSNFQLIELSIPRIKTTIFGHLSLSLHISLLKTDLPRIISQAYFTLAQTCSPYTRIRSKTLVPISTTYKTYRHQLWNLLKRYVFEQIHCTRDQKYQYILPANNINISVCKCKESNGSTIKWNLMSLKESSWRICFIVRFKTV